MKKWLLLLIAMMPITALADRLVFDKDWKFIQQDVSRAEQAGFDDADWRVLDLPHDWSIEGDYDRNHPMGDRCGYLPAGIGWYRKTIAVPSDWKGKHVEIAFDGVYMNSTVWANGKKLGLRPYGWISFAYDISDLVQTSSTLTFAVRVDNEKQPSARWYTGSGIYAHTWINVKHKVHVPHSGVFVRTQGSKIEIDTDVANTTSILWKGHVNTSVIDAAGKVVGRAKSLATVGADNTETTAQTITLANPCPMCCSPNAR